MQNICYKIDPTLKYRGTLEPSSVGVYQVERDGNFYVLKIAIDEWDRNHLAHERKILLRCEDVSGITHLVQSYQQPHRKPVALLKEYMEGNDLSENHSKIPRESIDEIRTSLEDTVRELHAKRIANLELFPRNIVVSPDYSSTKIIDLGTAHRFSRREDAQLRRRIVDDLEDFDYLF